MPLKAHIHKSLSQNNAPLQMAGFGALTGILAGLVVNLFRFVLEGPLPLVAAVADHDDFEALPAWSHFLLPVAGSALLAAMLYLARAEHRSLGVMHVIDKIQNFKGPMPAGNAVLQFFGGALALLSGHSCGREGPAIHLGATSSSLLGSFFNLPNNSIRVLIACGSSAAIAASFNTPISGVIFTMEVILGEYSIQGFIPVIVAAVAGAVVTQIFYGGEPVFMIESAGMGSLWELPYVVFMGVVIGVLATVFITVQKYCLTFDSIDLRKRLLLAGVLTGTMAVFIPEIMGTSYDTLHAAMQSELPLTFLAWLLGAKLVITAIILGLGIPGGIIGPSLMIGGIAGALLSNFGNMAIAGYLESPTIYVLLGMCAMMGAVLQAPLAALMAMLELSSNPNLILPGMLIIVVANLTSSEGFATQSIYQVGLQKLGIKTSKTISRLLSRYGVNSIMNQRVATVKLEDVPTEAVNVLAREPDWIVLEEEDERRLIERESLAALADSDRLDHEAAQGLFERGLQVVPVSLHATLQQAMETLQNADLEAGYVHSPFKQSNILGIITVDDIIAFYKQR